MKPPLLQRLRERAAQSREYAQQAPNAKTREELIEEAEMLETEAGPQDKHPPRPFAITVVAIIAVVAVVAAVAAFLVVPILWPRP